jgi:predicted GH43/DUF377 family glycosyl hydrolase
MRYGLKDLLFCVLKVVVPAQMKINLDVKGNIKGLGVYINEDEKPIILYYSGNTDTIQAAISDDGEDFVKADLNFKIEAMPSAIRLSPIFKNYILFGEQKSEKLIQTFQLTSTDRINWQNLKTLPNGIGMGINIDNYVYENQHVFLFGGEQLRIGLTDTGENWKFYNLDVTSNNQIYVDYALKTSQGIFALYHHYSLINNKKCLEVKAICFDKNNPIKIIWSTKNSLWQEPELWAQKEASCMGTIYFQGKLLSYWDVPNMGIFLVTYPIYDEIPNHEHKHYKLEKHPNNPILAPVPENNWENEATFNAAAFYEDGKVYLIYRAVGHDYISVLGYAESTDGINFDTRLDSPIFTGSAHFDTRSPRTNTESIYRYASGPGYGGCEDPRITKIDDKLYMVYVAFNGYSEPRLAITSILYTDFMNHRFLWEKPVLISPPGVVDKSGCVLPEKINGKYVIFHRVYPDILIDYVDDLEFDGTTFLRGQYKISPRPTMWDSRKIGTGAPPIKTKDGWLLIYQGVNDRDDSKYRIGAMLLDLNDPTKVLYRANHPIIEPTEHYENGLAKFGVVYPCGAVVVNGKLLVYYGGSDSVTCVASANLDEFLKELREGSSPVLTPININD